MHTSNTNDNIIQNEKIIKIKNFEHVNMKYLRGKGLINLCLV